MFIVVKDGTIMKLEFQKAKFIKCNICKSKFQHKSNLQEHLQSHDKERVFECEVCHYKFTFKSQHADSSWRETICM